MSASTSPTEAAAAFSQAAKNMTTAELVETIVILNRTSAVDSPVVLAFADELNRR